MDNCKIIIINLIFFAIISLLHAISLISFLVNYISVLPFLIALLCFDTFFYIYMIINMCDDYTKRSFPIELLIVSLVHLIMILCFITNHITIFLVLLLTLTCLDTLIYSALTKDLFIHYFYNNM